MKISKAGITMYESTDLIESDSELKAIGIAMNRNREEINKIAEIIDRMQEKIDLLQKQFDDKE